jgi:hypothetical protein
VDVQKIVSGYRLKVWEELVKARMESGQGIKEFCKENGISVSTYYNRQKKVRLAACLAIAEKQNGTQCSLTVTNIENNAPTNLGWMQVTEVVSAKERLSELTVEINGCKVTVTENTDAALLEKTCRMLKVL